jgi:hypothetical protein
MPGSGGLQTLFVLRNTPETTSIPVIVVSGIIPRILDLIPAAEYPVKPGCKRHLFSSSTLNTSEDNTAPSQKPLALIFRNLLCCGYVSEHVGRGEAEELTLRWPSRPIR